MNYKPLSQVAKYRSDRITYGKVTDSNYISTENMLPDRGGIENATTVPDAKTFPKYVSQDILLSNIRPYFKKIWYANVMGGCSNDVLVVRPNGIDPKFLYYVLSDANFFNYSTATAKGTKMPRGSKTAIMKYLVPDIDTYTQTRIAAILSAYDDAIENNNRRIALLEKAAQVLYNEWFVRFRFPSHENEKFVNGLPEGWEVKRLGELTQIIDGDRGTNYPKQEEFFNEGYCLFLNAANVTKNGFDFGNNAYVTEEKDKVLRKGRLLYNDIILTTRGTVGNVAFYSVHIPYDIIRINSGMVILRHSGEVPPAFLYLALRNDSIQKMIELYSSGSAQPQLPIKDMRKMKILKPTDELLKKFALIVENMLSSVALLQSQSQNLARQRDMLLPRLMSGKLEVQVDD